MAVGSGIAESHVEEAALAWLSELGYATANGLEIGPDGHHRERASYRDTLLLSRLRAAITSLNPDLSPDMRAEVLAKLTRSETPATDRGKPPPASLSGRGRACRGATGGRHHQR